MRGGCCTGSGQGQGYSTGVWRKGHSDEKCNQGEKLRRLWAPQGVGGPRANCRASAAMCRSLH